MIITRMRWADVPDGSLVIGPSGRVYELLGKYVDDSNRPWVGLDKTPTGRPGGRTMLYVDPNTETEVLTTEAALESATDALSRFFALERVKP